MIDVNIGIQPGLAKHGMLILAQYSATKRLAYILKGQFGAGYMEIQDSEGTLVARVTELGHLARKSDWKVEFEDKQRSDVVFKPHGYFSSKWTAEFDGKVWDVGGGNAHKVTSGSTEIGIVQTSHITSPGARRISAVSEKDVLILVAFAGAFYLRDLKQKPIAMNPGAYT